MPADRLSSHLSSWLGAWPSGGPTSLIITSSPRRSEPGWDGSIRPVAGVATAEGAVLSVPAEHVEAVRELGDTLEAIAPALPRAVGKAGWRFYRGVFR